MVPRETQGRQGKDDSGPAKSREAKLGCVFTQTSLDLSLDWVDFTKLRQ